MSTKPAVRLSRNFQHLVQKELDRKSRATVAIMSLNLGCPQDLFARTQAKIVRETIALLPCEDPNFRALDIRANHIYCLLCGDVPALMALVDDAHHSLVVLEAKYPQHVRMCMSMTAANSSDTAADLLNRTEEMLLDAVLDFA